VTSRSARTCLFTTLTVLAFAHANAQHERIAPATSKTLSAQEAGSARLLFERLTFPNPDGTLLPYRLLRPQQPAGQRFPLVIMLHGSDKIGTDNEGQLADLALAWALPANRQQFPAFVAVPQFPGRTSNYDLSLSDHLLASHPASPLLPLFDLVDQLTATFPIDPNRVYLVGFSMGGSGAWQSLLIQPEKFAAAVILSGTPPDRILASRFRRSPLLICHGDADPENPYAAALAMFEAIGPDSEARFRTYTGMVHTAPPDIADPASTWWRDWLFSQHR